MPGFIDGKLRAVWQADCRKKPPTLIGDLLCHFDALALQFAQGGLDVVTHEVKLVTALTVSWVDGKLGRGQGEDEPASSRVCRRQIENVGEERTDLVGCRGEEDCMHASDHVAILAPAQALLTPIGGGSARLPVMKEHPHGWMTTYLRLWRLPHGAKPRLGCIGKPCPLNGRCPGAVI